MAKVAAKYGGIYASHMRGEGKELVQSVDELIQIAEKGGLPGEVFHFKAAYSPGWGKLLKEAGRHIEAARARGVDVAADLYVYTAGGTGLEATIPSWAHEGATRSPTLTRDTPFPVATTIPTPSDTGTRPRGGFHRPTPLTTRRSR